MKTPNRFQAAIYTDTESGLGHTVVLARAGTGKTTTIVDALGKVPRGLSVLMVAFNKKIADELKRRAPAGVEVLTCHSLGLRTITAKLGRSKIDNDKTWKAFGDLFPRASRKATRPACRLVSLAKATLADGDAALDNLIDEFSLVEEDQDDDRPEVTREFLIRAAGRLLRHAREFTAAIDFDDMIWLPNVLGLTPRKFDRVFVDETQDLNRAQVELALAACAPGGRICAVGDDRQAIYAFRGADQDAIGGIVERLKAKTLPLSVTYRCPKSVVALAQQTVPDFEAAETNPEGEIAATDDATMLRDAAPGDFVISRANAPLIGICLALLKAGRKATITGKDIGASLISVVDRAKATYVSDLTTWIENWCARETSRLLAKNPPQEDAANLVWDKADCIHALSEGAADVAEVRDRITSLFSDMNDRNAVVLSTTHKAKGLEADRVWVLADTYRPAKSVEEANLWYVAITRTKSKLFLVRPAAA